MKIQYFLNSTKFPKKLQIQILHQLQPSFVGPRGQTNNLYLNQFHFDAARVHLFWSFNFFYSQVLGAQLMSLIIEKCDCAEVLDFSSIYFWEWLAFMPSLTKSKELQSYENISKLKQFLWFSSSFDRYFTQSSYQRPQSRQRFWVKK